MTVSSPIHVVTNGIISFYLMTEYYSTVYMYDIIFIHSCQWTLGCFHVLAIANSAAVITGVHVSFWTMFSLDI